VPLPAEWKFTIVHLLSNKDLGRQRQVRATSGDCQIYQAWTCLYKLSKFIAKIASNC